MPRLSFITDENLERIVSKFLEDYNKIVSKAPAKLESSTLDPFSAILFSVCSGMELNEWKKDELNRQIGKSFQNKVGELHQNILGNCIGCEVIDNVIDIRNREKKIIAEIKNKYNTTKGSDRKTIYDNLSLMLELPEYNGFTGYFVEIVAKNKQHYDKCFIPSDNLHKGNRSPREDIRVIDGVSFYAKVTGIHDALKQFYEVLPIVIQDIRGTGIEMVEDPLFDELFNKTF